MALIDRQLIQAGEIVLVLEIGAGGLELIPVADWDVSGGYSPEPGATASILPDPQNCIPATTYRLMASCIPSLRTTLKSPGGVCRPYSLRRLPGI